ncbi:MAG: DUF1127 domain-containing protein [Paracoccus sp. (in: a-proteobacteria)]|nr:DUF1127 domain-containing protein [Paracoccus sp. (in: a-proteobacteria)]
MSYAFAARQRAQSRHCAGAAFIPSLVSKTATDARWCPAGSERDNSGPGPKSRNVRNRIMAAIDHIQNSVRQNGIGARLMTAIERMQENRARAAVYRQTLRELNALTNRDLEDLGIHRSMIKTIANEAAYGKQN